VTITHHELCFGCGIANLFGLQLEVEPAADGEGVSGRFFVKQDHQGPPGYAHGGVIACALDEAMALCVHDEGRLAMTGRLEVLFRAPVPVGTFVRVAARVTRREGRRLELTAEARGVGGERPLIAEASAAFLLMGEDWPEAEPAG
jgi:acyl-coenzyme A thioesterase PaaI-like protein